jgi:uncharacterized YigZ family protein
MAFFEITGIGEGFLKEKGSKFYGFAFPIKDEADIKKYLGQVQKKYYDARHHCYAYRLGNTGEKTGLEDDGEPSHTAGDPILGQIRSRNLTNTLVIVVRYFGGTLLGVRGLIDAYKGAAAAALEDSPTVEIIPVFRFTLIFPYEKTAEINRLLHPFPTQLCASSYTDTCTQQYQIHIDHKAAIVSTFQDCFGYAFIIEEESESKRD